MTTIDERERGYENKFQHDDELTFRAGCEGAKLMGQWAAQEMGFNMTQMAAYIEQALEAEIRKAEHVALLDKIEKDLESNGRKTPRGLLENRLVDFIDTAAKKLHGA